MALSETAVRAPIRPTNRGDMSNPTLADLFCCEGGAANGYVRAGFDVHGVDIEERKRRRYMLSGATSFTAADVNEAGIEEFDAVHASPPCEDHFQKTTLALI